MKFTCILLTTTPFPYPQLIYAFIPETAEDQEYLNTLNTHTVPICGGIHNGNIFNINAYIVIDAATGIAIVPPAISINFNGVVLNAECTHPLPSPHLSFSTPDPGSNIQHIMIQGISSPIMLPQIQRPRINMLEDGLLPTPNTKLNLPPQETEQYYHYNYWQYKENNPSVLPYCVDFLNGKCEQCKYFHIPAEQLGVVPCYICNKYGHNYRSCWQKK